MKLILKILIFLFSYALLFAQQNDDSYNNVLLTVKNNSPVWTSTISEYTNNNITRRLFQGDRVLGDRVIWTIINHENIYLAYILFNNYRYAIHANDLLPIVDERLPNSWIKKKDSERKWIISYYLDIIRSQDRNTFLSYEKSWINSLIEDMKHSIALGEFNLINKNWYNELQFIVNFESLVFLDAVVIMGGFDRRPFFITNIESYSNGYRLTLSGDSYFMVPTFGDFSTRLAFPLRSEQTMFKIIFIPDGDYMDVYLNDLNSYFYSFALVNSDFTDELFNLVENNTIDISRIIWPRRADGSMDYPPPSGVDLSRTYERIDFSNNVYFSNEEEIENTVINEITNGTDKVIFNKENEVGFTLSFWVWIVVGVGAVVAIIAVVIVRKRN